MVNSLLEATPGLSKADIAKKMKVKPQVLSNHLNPDRPLPEHFAYDFIEAFGLNKEYFETGLGNPLTKSVKLYTQDEEEISQLSEHQDGYQVNEVKNVRVPIYDVEFSAGVMTTLIESRENHFPVGYLGIPEVIGCDAIIRAKGDSMADRIHDRDWIGIKRIQDWQEWLPMGYIYAIITDNHELIKYLKKGSSPDNFTIASHNKFYEDDEIPKSKIKEIWSVKAVLPFSQIETII